jgi:apolipoprotein N-acyltransferase
MSEPAAVIAPPSVVAPARLADPMLLPRCAAAIAGGTLYFLGYVGWGVWPCLLVFLVPLWWALAEEPAPTLRGSMLIGLAFGGAAYAGGHLWLWSLVDPFFDGRRVLGAVLWSVYGLWFALAFVVYAALFWGIRRRGWPIAIAGVPALVLIEWRQPQIFPLYAGNGLVAVPVLAQTADLGGPLLLTALLGATSAIVYASIEWWNGRRRSVLTASVAGLALAAAVLGYGRVRMAAVDARAAETPALRVGVVQANLDIRDKDRLGVATHRQHLAQTRELLADGDLELVVWPESAYVRGIRRPLPLSGRPIVDDLAVPLLFGASSVQEVEGRKIRSNSALLVGDDGTIRDVYDKNLLIPLAESTPFAGVLPALARLFPHAEEFLAARDVPALRLGPWRIATPICYEAIRPEFVRRMMRESHPDLLITLANDAWFGDSQEPWLHLALAQLRAIEQRRYLVRATNSGVSAVVDAAGRVVRRTGLLTRENLRGTVHPLDGETLYARFGDWPGWTALAMVVLALVLRAPNAPDFRG